MRPGLDDVDAGDADGAKHRQEIGNLLCAKLVELGRQSEVEQDLLLRGKECLRAGPSPNACEGGLQYLEVDIDGDLADARVEEILE